MAMTKRIYFGEFDGRGWPEPERLRPYFLGPPEQLWAFQTRNDHWGISLEGVDGTDHLKLNNGRIDIELEMYGHPDFGVLLFWAKRRGATFSSKGDLSRLQEWVRTLHGDLRPVGLFIPFEEAWKAVKEFIETDGALPRSIEWIANRDLPPDVFPEPHAKVSPIYESGTYDYSERWRGRN